MYPPAMSDDSTFANLVLVDASTGFVYGVVPAVSDGNPDEAFFSFLSGLVVPAGQTVEVDLRTDTSGTNRWWYFDGLASGVSAQGRVSGSAPQVSVTDRGDFDVALISGDATLTITRSSATPVTSVVAVGTSGTGIEVPALVLDLDAAFENVDVTGLAFTYVPEVGDNAIWSFADSGIKLYRRTNGGSEILVGSTSFVASGPVSGQYTARYSLPRGALVLNKDATEELIVKVVYSGTSNGTAPASSPHIQFGDGVQADSAHITARGVSSGNILTDDDLNGTNSLQILASEKVLYRSYPTFTRVSPSLSGDNSLVNAIEQTLYRFRVRADSAGNISLKQLKFDVDIMDNSAGVDNALSAGQFRLWRNNADITSDVSFWSGSDIYVGAPSGSSLGEGAAQSLYLVWNGSNEESVTAGFEDTYEIRAMVSGFTADSDNDYLRVRPANSEVSTGELNQGVHASYLLAQPYSVTPHFPLRLGTQDQLTATVLPPDIIWSDRSGTGHSAAVATTTPGVLAASTPDWFNGYALPGTPLDYWVLTR